jgi:hypothetical protein
MAFLSDILNKVKNFNPISFGASVGASAAKSAPVQQAVQQLKTSGGNFFTKTLPSMAQSAVNTPVLDVVPGGQAASRSLQMLNVSQPTLKNNPLTKQFIYNPQENKYKGFFPSSLPTQTAKLNDVAKISGYNSPEYQSKQTELLSNLALGGLTSEVKPISGATGGLLTEAKSVAGALFKDISGSKSSLKIPVDTFIARFKPSQEFVANLEKGIKDNGVTIKKVGTDIQATFSKKFIPPEGKLLFTAKPPIEKNFTPVNQKKLTDIYAKNSEQQLQQGADKLLSSLKLKSRGTPFPFENKLAKEQNVNMTSGLPAEGLPSQEAKKGNMLTWAASKLFQESSKVLEGMGPAGKQLKTRVLSALDTAEREAGAKVADLQNVVKGISNRDFPAIIKGLRGEADGLPQDHPIIQGVRKVLDSVYADAKKAGIDVGYLKNYAPQLVDKEKLAGNIGQVAQYFVDTKQFPSYEAASSFLNDVVNGADQIDSYSKYVKPLSKKMGSLEFQRVLQWPADVLRGDKQLLPDYIAQAYERINQVKNFGTDNKIKDNLLSQLEKQGYDKRRAQDIVDRALGLVRNDPTTEKLFGIARNVQSIIKLPLAAISNLNQSTNTAASFGAGRTVQEIAQYLAGGKMFKEDVALRTGATLESSLKEIKDQWTGGGLVGKIAAPFFGNVEKFNRVIAANTGVRYATDMFTKLLKNPNDRGALQSLKDLGIDAVGALQRGHLTNDELMKAGQMAVKRTQFKTRSIDLPDSWSGSIGKTAVQFKPFAYKQGQFVVNELLKPLTKGNPVPLATYLLVGGLITGELSNDVKALINHKDRPDNLLARFGENVSAVGGAGLFQSTLQGLQYGGQGVVGTLAGPTASDIYGTTLNAAQLLKGNPKPLAKQTVSDIPFVGKPIVNANPQVFTNKKGVKAPTSTSPLSSIFGGKNDAANTVDSTDALLGSGSAVDEAALNDKITELNKQRKDVLTKDGYTIPFINKQVGGLTTEEKNKQIGEIDKVIKVLKEQKSLSGVEDYLQPNPETGIKKYEWDAKQIDWAKKIYSSDISDTQKQTLIGRMGLKQEDIAYDYIASQTSNAKSDYMYSTLKDAKHEDVINTLIQGRYEGLSGKMTSDNATLANLRDKGLITNAEYKELIKYKFDKNGQNIGSSAYSSGSSAKERTLINAISTAFAKGRTRPKSLKSIMASFPKSSTSSGSSKISDILASKRKQLKVSDKPKV